MHSQIHPIKPLKIAALLSPSQNIADTILSYLSLLLSHTSSEQRNDATTAFTVPPTGKRNIHGQFYTGGRAANFVDLPRRGEMDG
jgi:hypothetical protein